MTAPNNADVRGTMLLVCPLVEGECDWDGLGALELTGSGTQTPFATPELPDGEYGLIAWKDNEPKNQFGAEDYFGVYSPDQKAMGHVRPPASNVKINMVAFSEPGTAGPPADAPRTAVPAQLVGNWSTLGSSGGGYYNPANGTWSPAGGQGLWYEIRADGTFVFSSYIESRMYGCTINFFKYHTGTVAVQGDHVVFTATKAHQRFEDTCNPSRNYEKEWYPKADVYKWGTGVRDGRSSMVLVEDGKQEGLFFYRSQ
ncbi:hypothetical protein [Deinococcus sonorensis]|uniref:Uncharacterized protein n=1 Tax=Deinococcus sonorensis KR-87 TaxID=694439 RepID=A0AAU7U4F0_9DEIO